jgi:hypothetical protein
MSLKMETLGSVASRGVGRPDYSAPYSTLFATDSGYATSGGATTLVDLTKNWQTDIWKNAEVDLYIGAIKYTRYVVSNTATTLLFSSIAPAAVAVGTQYALRDRSGIDYNRSSWIHGQVLVPIAGTPVQLPDVTIPDGFSVTLTPLPGNGGIIYAGNSAADVLDTLKRVALDSGQPRSWPVTNLNLIWIDAQVSGEGVDWQAVQ